MKVRKCAALLLDHVAIPARIMLLASEPAGQAQRDEAETERETRPCGGHARAVEHPGRRCASRSWRRPLHAGPCRPAYSGEARGHLRLLAESNVRYIERYSPMSLNHMGRCVIGKRGSTAGEGHDPHRARRRRTSGAQESPIWAPRREFQSGSSSPEPPAWAGKSLSFGRPSFTGSTASR